MRTKFCIFCAGNVKRDHGDVMDLKKCESCGMPMTRLSDFGGMKGDNRYCKHCTYENGDLRPRHEVREGMVLYYMKTKKKDRRSAEVYVDEIMAGHPAWQ